MNFIYSDFKIQKCVMIVSCFGRNIFRDEITQIYHEIQNFLLPM